ncbi:MAG TPA: hypothetical protein VF793_04395 [Telluria sp.]
MAKPVFYGSARLRARRRRERDLSTPSPHGPNLASGAASNRGHGTGVDYDPSWGAELAYTDTRTDDYDYNEGGFRRSKSIGATADVLAVGVRFNF